MSKVLGIDALAGIRDWVKSEDDAVKAELRTYIGSPLVASTVGGMTDHTKVYVYTGSETGYTAGNWYYYNGSAWTSGGVYNSTALETDPTLTIEGMAADAKATGDKIAKNTQDITELETSMETKADTDGTYDQMTVGNAEQLTTDKGIVEKVPYLLRASGGDGADREVDKIVGGTVAWSQLIGLNNLPTDSGLYSATTYTVNGVTFTKNNDGSINVATVESGASGNAVVKIGSTNTLPSLLYNKNLIRCIGGSATTCYINYLSSRNVVGEGIYDSTESNFNMWLKVDEGTIITNPIKVYPQVTDLTQMFGTAIADRAYALEKATAGSGIAWLKSMGFFTESYYPYDAGTLKSVEGLTAHNMVGFNQFNSALAFGNIDNTGSDSGTNASYIRSADYTRVFPNTTYCFYASTDQQFMQLYVIEYDANKNFISRNAVVTGSTLYTTRFGSYTLNANTHYVRMFIYKTAVFTTLDNVKFCISLSDPAKNGTYEPYVKHSYPLDSTLTLRGIPKLDANNQVYYDGDTYEADGTVKRRYGIVDLGTLNWVYSNSQERFDYNSDIGIKRPSSNSDFANIFCLKYITGNAQNISDLQVAVNTSGYLRIKDSTAGTDAATFKTAMSGVYLVYELATPTTETAEPYQNPQIVDPYGTEGYETTGIVPVGHETFYPENLRAKIEGLPFNFATLIAPTESTYKATMAYSTGNLFIVDNILYKATTSIASGGTITPGTNCTATTLAEIIAALS